MTWIRTIPPAEADPELRRVYETLRGLYPAEYHTDVDALVRPEGGTDSIVAAHSLLPDAMFHVMSAHATLIQPDMPLTLELLVQVGKRVQGTQRSSSRTCR